MEKKTVLIRVNKHIDIPTSIEFFQRIFAFTSFVKSRNLAINAQDTRFFFVTDENDQNMYTGLEFQLVIYDPWFVPGRNKELDVFLIGRASMFQDRV